MESKIRDIIHKLYENPQYNAAIKLIGEYAPNIRFVFDKLHENFSVSLINFDIPIKKYNLESGKYITNEACEFKFYFDDFENISEQIDIYPSYILKSKVLNPDVGDEIVIRVILYCTKLEGKDKKTKEKLKGNILKIGELPNSKGEKKHWWYFVNTWVGESYILKDLGTKDVDGLSKLLCKSINQTYAPLKKSLQKLVTR